MEACLVILIWDTQYWSAETVPTSIISQADQAYYFYNLTIRKTYTSVAAMQADVNNPIGNDGRYIKVGEIVSVHNEDNPEEDAIYSWETGPSIACFVITILSAPKQISVPELKQLEGIMTSISSQKLRIRFTKLHAVKVFPPFV